MEHSVTRVLCWNANGILHRWNELEHFILSNFIDIALISETHLVPANLLRKIPGYSVYCCCHPSGNPRGGSLILVKNHIAHTDAGMYCTPEIQCSVITVSLLNAPVNIGKYLLPT